MAITAAQLDALPNYTDAQLLAAIRVAITKVALAGQSTTLLGQTVTNADMQSLLEAASFFERRITESANGGNMIALARFGRPR